MDKERLVREVFDSVAPSYDLMNDLMSAGLHRHWKHHAIERTDVRPGHEVLDLAGGTGDMALALLGRLGGTGRVVLADINASMLAQGRRRLEAAGGSGRYEIAQVNAENMPFETDRFDRITIAFGLRNVTDKAAALRSMFRVLKPGGRALVLEFSRPRRLMRPAYAVYSFGIVPLLGWLVANDGASYRYLAESIRRHPDQETLLAMMRDAGFERCSYENLSGGIVAVHMGHKPA